MHTVKVICLGFALLASCCYVGWKVAGPNGLATGSLVFLPLWLIGTGINLYLGTKHGYTVREELPIQAIVFLVPAAISALAIFHFR